MRRVLLCFILSFTVRAWEAVQFVSQETLHRMYRAAKLRGSSVALTMAEQGQACLLENFIIFYDGFDDSPPLIVVALDLPTYNVCQEILSGSRSHTCVFGETAYVTDSESPHGVQLLSTEYRLLNKLFSLLTSILVADGKIVLRVDIDVVFIRSPRLLVQSFLESTAPNTPLRLLAQADECEAGQTSRGGRKYARPNIGVSVWAVPELPSRTISTADVRVCAQLALPTTYCSPGISVLGEFLDEILDDEAFELDAFERQFADYVEVVSCDVVVSYVFRSTWLTSADFSGHVPDSFVKISGGSIAIHFTRVPSKSGAMESLGLWNATRSGHRTCYERGDSNSYGLGAPIVRNVVGANVGWRSIRTNAIGILETLIVHGYDFHLVLAYMNILADGVEACDPVSSIDCAAAECALNVTAAIVRRGGGKAHWVELLRAHTNEWAWIQVNPLTLHVLRWSPIIAGSFALAWGRAADFNVAGVAAQLGELGALLPVLVNALSDFQAGGAIANGAQLEEFLRLWDPSGLEESNTACVVPLESTLPPESLHAALASVYSAMYLTTREVRFMHRAESCLREGRWHTLLDALSGYYWPLWPLFFHAFREMSCDDCPYQGFRMCREEMRFGYLIAQLLDSNGYCAI